MLFEKIIRNKNVPKNVLNYKKLTKTLLSFYYKCFCFVLFVTEQ